MSSNGNDREEISILGGTGREGRGLGLRLARAGHRVSIGSRRLERANATAESIRERLREIGTDADVSGYENAAAAVRAEIVVLCWPFPGLRENLPAFAETLAGRIVVDVINPMERRSGALQAQVVPEGSAAELVRALLPESRLVSAFKNESATELARIEHPAEGDVLICGDDTDAKRRVARLVRDIPDLRPIDAGPLASAQSVEAITALLLNLNRMYRAVTSVRIVGLDGVGGE